VLYVGLDNPIDVSVPGIAQSDVIATIDSRGSLMKNRDGNYIAKMTAAGIAKVQVKAKVDGREMIMGEQQFRVKNVPSPVTTIDGVYEGGRITLVKLRSTTGVLPLLKDFDFGGARFTVESYQVLYKSVKEGNVSIPYTNAGPLYDEKTKDIVKKRVQAGDDIYFDEIWVRGPAGDKRKINPISFSISK